MNAKSKFGLAAVILAIFFSLFAAAPAPASAAVPGCTQTHTVVSGEYLTKIANQYGVTWSWLADINDLEDANLIYKGQVLCVRTTGTPTAPTTPTAPISSTVRVFAASAVEDKSVTVKGKALDSASFYSIYLSNHKITGAVEYYVGTVKTGSDGSFTATFSIPKLLYDVSLLRIRAANSRGDSSSNWFINTTGSGSIGGTGSPAIAISIDDVKEGKWVKITASNLPANVTFLVYIAKANSSDPVYVGMIRSTNGSKVTATFDLPSEYFDRAQLEIQLENQSILMEAARDFDND